MGKTALIVPDLSIVIPIYNGSQYLDSSICSIQTFCKDIQYEIILIDDGSIDDSWAICRSFQQACPNILSFHQPNAGIASARNLGLKFASGRYILFFDQDDFFINPLKSFIESLDTSGADFLIAEYCETNGNGDVPQGQVCNTFEAGQPFAYAMVRSLISRELLCSPQEQRQLPIYWGTIWNCIFRLSYIREKGIEVRRFVDFEDDWLFVIDSLTYASHILFTSSAFYSHRNHQQSESFRHKLIPHFFEGREFLNQWIYDRLIYLGVSSASISRVYALYEKDTRLWGFCNSMVLSMTDYLHYIRKERNRYRDFSLIKPFIHSPREFVLLRLLHAGFYRLSYCLNRYCFHLEYH